MKIAQILGNHIFYKETFLNYEFGLFILDDFLRVSDLVFEKLIIWENIFISLFILLLFFKFKCQ